MREHLRDKLMSLDPPNVGIIVALTGFVFAVFLGFFFLAEDFHFLVWILGVATGAFAVFSGIWAGGELDLWQTEQDWKDRHERIQREHFS